MRLKRAVVQVKKERDLLKEAAFFAKQPKLGMPAEHASV
jgi:hypothetical protein